MTAIPPPRSPDVLSVLAAIRSAGGRPMLVGGYVRDALLHPDAPAKDIDIEVYGITDPTRLAFALAATGKVTEAGRQFGVFKVRSGEHEFDVSLPRRESKAGAGHRGFDVIPDGAMGYAEASARRDFTVNSMLADPETGEVTDCHGGLADLNDRVLRQTSPAFGEDPLRVLRGVQLAARLGFWMEHPTVITCQGLVPAYAELAAERIWCEWEKIGTRGVSISAGLRVLARTHWEQHYPQIAGLHRLWQDPAWHPEGDVWTHSRLAADQAARLADEAGLAGTDRLVIVFAALCHDFGKITHTRVADNGRITSHGHAAAGVHFAEVFLRSIGCPEAITARILPLIREHMCCITRPTKPAVRRLARRLAPARLEELALVVGADHAGRGDPDAPNPADPWLEMAQGLSVQQAPARGLLTGDHLIAAGMTPGPEFRPILADAVAAQDEGEFEDEAGALRWLGERMAS